eukprot:CAMPEP_0206592546 /NCGR_PEP_ID=MMETSP0325_2-20121206/41029_1 /ASSEMBLY_ACC=CAM_ASM_000347 /TAXON_ID=2866 /ORGANISM="Crypthecodinium cohnii, Strain Seligo" /LENGTH=425 /DNA_ID=CAMNT_0054102209 /DNA_START=123 /DNA_END=1396 /DNA_ORIENTATION=+
MTCLKRPAPDEFGVDDAGCKAQKLDTAIELGPTFNTGGSSGSTASIVRQPVSAAELQALGARLRAGKLVAFPTETVYGLGANGLNPDAVLDIFKAKGRPLTDPCILHVAHADQAYELLDLGPLEKSVFECLTSSVWPGPLSVVGRARSVVPKVVTAQTDFVAVRCPNHPLALELLKAAQVPVAAPSANRFGHISPTLAEHVLEDLGSWPGLKILDGGACNVGIESTVVKLDLDNNRVLILRKGGATMDRLKEALDSGFKAGSFGTQQISVELYTHKIVDEEEVESAKVTSSSKPAKAEEPVKCDESEAQQAPGMMLKHYAPAVPTFLLRTGTSTSSVASLKKTILIDFGAALKGRHADFLKCFDLCAATGCSEEACQQVFAVLREAEAFALAHEAEAICLTDVSSSSAPSPGSFTEALYDRLYRA